MNEPEDPKALARQRVILDVLAQRMNATEGAVELGVSRKTFYEWMERGLSGMRSALRDRPGGRPRLPVDPWKEQLEQELDDLKKERVILEGRLRIQQVIRQTLEEQRPATPKKKGTL